MDGVLDAWDLLQQHNEPVLTIKVCDEPLLCMRAHESGRFISAGSKNGAAFMIEVSDNMTSSLKNDKPLLTAMFDRENKREKILEAKLREIKLKVKTAQLVHGNDNDANDSKMTKATANEVVIKQAENDYLRAVEKEKSKLFPKLYKHKRRKTRSTSTQINGGDHANASENDRNGRETENDDDDDEYEEDEDGSLVSE